MSAGPEHTTAPAWRRALDLALVAASVAAIAVLYHAWGNTADPALFSTSAFRWLRIIWSSTPMFGGAAFVAGWIVPILVLLLLWRDRRELRALPASPSWLGLGVVLLALAMHWMGLRSQQTRLSWLALVLLAWAIPFHLYGWPRARRLIGPCALLGFLVPFNFLDVFTFPLQRATAAIAGLLLAGLGLPIVRRGSLLQVTPEGQVDPTYPPFDGATAAGGVGMMLTLALAAMFIWAWKRRRFRHGAILLAISPLVHVAANLVRLVVVALIQAAAGGPAGAAFDTRASSPLVALCGMVLLLAIDAIPGWWKRKQPWRLLQPTRPPID